MHLCLANACIDFHTHDSAGLYKSLTTDFARRYIPTLQACEECSRGEARVYWLEGSTFSVLSASFSDEVEDVYVVSGPYPEAYVNESPVFFVLQVLARCLSKRGSVLVTDSVFIHTDTKGVLLLGFPHTGKSTIATIATDRGYTVVSTENTVITVRDKKLVVEGGTRVLVFDPKIRELYGVKLESTGKTKHGYEIVDLDLLKGSAKPGFTVDEIYVLYTSFSSYGVNVTPIKGRKVGKLMWYFATGLLKGVDYYEPQPLDIPLTAKVRNTLSTLIRTVQEKYSGRFYEVFGSPLEVFEYIAKEAREDVQSS